MDDSVALSRGGIHLMRLAPVKGAEIGKRRPCVILTTDVILGDMPLLFICPLSSRSDPRYRVYHVPIPSRDRLEKPSFALIERCRSISRRRILSERLATLTPLELGAITHRLGMLIQADEIP